MNQTINYYNTNAQSFYENTIHADMSHVQNKFLSYVIPGGTILDAGCGSGRDSKYFLEKGYQVEAFDASRKLCRMATDYAGIPVECMTFQEMTVTEKYDGIWACASLLHVCKEELPSVMDKLVRGLKKDGILYASFKYGDSEREKDGRFFSDYTEEAAIELLEEAGIEVKECFVTGDVRNDRGGEMWVNLIGVNISSNSIV